MLRATRAVARIACLASMSAASLAAAQDAQRFYSEHSINFLIGAPAGGVLDVPGRLVARHIGKHLPGRPNIVASNMPGAASNILGRHLFAQAPKDGATIGMVFPGVTMEALFSAEDRRGYDPSKFNFLGSAQNYVPTCVARRDAPVRSARDLLTTELIAGGTAPGNMTFDFPTVADAIASAKFRMVKGYTSGPDLMLAVERNEIQATCSGWSIVKYKYPTILKGDGNLRAFMQGHMKGDPELNAAGVPTIASLLRSDDDRMAMDLFLSQNEYAGPFVAPPGVPADRVAALRAAFMETMRDPEYLAEAVTANIDVRATDGDAVQALVTKAYAAPAAVIERVKSALGR